MEIVIAGIIGVIVLIGVITLIVSVVVVRRWRAIVEERRRKTSLIRIPRVEEQVAS
jgi:Tfp pilus assembly protein PilW